MQLINITRTPIDYKINIEPARLEMKQADNARQRMTVDPSRLSIRSQNIQVRLNSNRMQASLNLRTPDEFARYYGSQGRQTAYENIGERVQFGNQIAQIQDDSEPQYDFARLFAEHPGDMIGFFIRALQKDDMSPVEKKALFYGINALLKTTDERS